MSCHSPPISMLSDSCLTSIYVQECTLLSCLEAFTHNLLTLAFLIPFNFLFLSFSLTTEFLPLRCTFLQILRHLHIHRDTKPGLNQKPLFVITIVSCPQGHRLQIETSLALNLEFGTSTNCMMSKNYLSRLFSVS